MQGIDIREKILHLTKEEETEGSRILWQFPPKALELITNCFYKLLPSPCEKDLSSVYHTKFIVKRDGKILEEREEIGKRIAFGILNYLNIKANEDVIKESKVNAPKIIVKLVFFLNKLV